MRMNPLHLAEPDDALLPRSPLTLVVCQVRHDRSLTVADPRVALSVQERLGGKYPQIGEWRSMAATMTFAAGAAPQVTQEHGASGWQMKSDDEAWTVTLQPDFFSLETSAYVDWSDFRSRIVELIDAVTDAYAPALETRIGLRYIDGIDDPVVTAAAGWRGLIRDELLGPLVHPELGDAVRSVSQQVEFDAGDGYRVTLRHGTGPVPGEAGLVYVLDHDCFRPSGRPFDAAEIMKAADDLHRIALQVFQSAITEKLYTYLKGVDAK
jgi:uncharacterized protein (TIGR04255 family)